jgi:transposase-like protein
VRLPDAQTDAFRTRRLDAEYPYVWFDARYEHVREDNRVQSMAVVVAYGVRAAGVREVLGLDVGLSEDGGVARVYAGPGRTRAAWGQTRHQRRPCRAQASH